MGLASLTDPSASIRRTCEHPHRQQPRSADRGGLRRAAEGKTEQLRAALEALIEPTSQEEGYVTYDLHQGVEDPSFFTFYENWLSSEHLDAHLAAPHLVEFANKMDDLLDESGITINRVRRIA